MQNTKNHKNNFWELDKFKFNSTEKALFWGIPNLETQQLSTKYKEKNDNKEFDSIDIILPLWRMLKNKKISKHNFNSVIHYAQTGKRPSIKNTFYKKWQEIISELKKQFLKKGIIKNI